MKPKIKVIVNYKYNNGEYKKQLYVFKTEQKWDNFFNKEISDEKVRKIIGIENQK